MSQEQIESLLDDLPRSEEARDRVLEWLRQYEDAPSRGVVTDPLLHHDNDDPVDDNNESEQDSERLGATASHGDPANSHNGSTASQGGPPGKGSTASQGGPNSIRKGSPASQGGSSNSRKRSSPDSNSIDGGESSRSSKRRKTDSEEEDTHGLTPFDPGDLVKSKDGTFKVPQCMQQYLNKHMKRCLTKEEREALFKEHPRPDLDTCVPPKVDKYMSEFLGKRLPKERDAEMAKIQSAVLASIRPLTSAWQLLLDAGLEEDPQMVVPGSEVLTLIQCTLCMIGNASELISQTRRSKILDAIDPSWSKFGEDSYASVHNTLFGESFQSSLTTMVEKDTALSKAVSITKRSKKEKEAPSTSSRRDRQRNDNFFRGGPPARYGGRQGKSFFPYSTYPFQKREGEYSRGKQYPNYQRPGQRPLYHEPKLPSEQIRKPQLKKL